jgi:hydroxypyruvate isomerase
MKRKEALKILATGSIGLNLGFPALGSAKYDEKPGLKGNINHSASRWCYNALDLDALCKEAKRIGLVGIDLLKPSEIDTVQGHGLVCTMVNPEEFSLTEGFNDPKLHSKLRKTYSQLIDLVADKGIQNVICFSGNRNGLDDQKGIDNCAKGLEPLVKQAADKGIKLNMELLNSKVDHEDYQCDHTEWGVALCKKIGSDHFKLLYDIYHMQIMEGDIIATIRKYHSYFGHYHTGGVPGRNEIDETQELNYPAIMQAIVATGFKGYVAQEFIPTATDPVESLEKSIAICDV